MVRALLSSAGMHHDDPTPEPARCAAPYRTTAPCPCGALAPAPRRPRGMALATLAVCAFTALTAVATQTAVTAQSRCAAMIATARPPRPSALREVPLAEAIDDLARMGRTPLYVASAVEPWRLRTPVPRTATAGDPESSLRALNAWAADRGLSLHVTDGVLRVDPAPGTSGATR